MTWHHFSPSSDDDQACAHCDLTVSDDALRLLAIDCPAPSCTDETNRGPCVMVLTDEEREDDRSAVCAYCERSGMLAEPDEGEPDGG